jgi:hypothetical protein
MTIRGCVFSLALLALSVAMSAPARADVRSIDPVQVLPVPPAPAVTHYYSAVAIDGGYIIVTAVYAGVQQALLYRRSVSTGKWLYRRALVTYSGPYVRFSITMKSGIAVVQFGDEIALFEASGGDYVRATSTAPIRHQGGVAISGKRVLIGGDGCDYDAVIYEKNAAGSWAITGRIDDNQGECLGPDDLAAVELNYDYALLRAKGATEARAWRRNGTAMNWIPAGTLALAPGESASDTNFALQGATAIGSNGAVWRRSGTSTWNRQGTLTSDDHDHAGGTVYDVLYRDNVVISSETAVIGSAPNLYIEASPGQFEHVGSLRTYENVVRYDVSGRTVVANVTDIYGQNSRINVFTLPSQMRAPVPVVNDFEDRNVTDFTFTGGQFALATRGSDDVLRQGASNGLAVATLNDTDWTDYQKVEAEITPTYSGTGSWVGLVARHVDADNYYYVAVRNNGTYGIYKRVNSVETLLFEAPFYNTQPPAFRATLSVVGNKISVEFSFQQGGPPVTDNSLTHGRAGVATWLARADFDDVHVAGTDLYLLFAREYGFSGYDYVSGLDELSGVWEVIQVSDGEESYQDGLAQRDISGDARAVIGTPVENQDIIARMRVDAFGPSQQGAWFGLLARYVDPNNHYYATIRSTGLVQIRKKVNGVVTVLASANFTPVIGQYYSVRFLVINDQLQLYVNQGLVAAAHDRALTKGKYGLGTYKAAANWDSFAVLQP